jgi:hypothetical protein
VISWFQSLLFKCNLCRYVKSICLDGCPKAAAVNSTVSWVCNYPDSKAGAVYT